MKARLLLAALASGWLVSCGSNDNANQGTIVTPPVAISGLGEACDVNYPGSCLPNLVCVPNDWGTNAGICVEDGYYSDGGWGWNGGWNGGYHGGKRRHHRRY